MSNPLFHYLPPSMQSGLRHARRAYRRWAGSRRLRHDLLRHTSRKIVVGSAGICEPGWITTDVEYLDLLQDTDWRRFFQENTIETILAEHVWEHLTPEQGLLAAQNCRHYIRPGGRLRIAVPDGFHPDPAYIGHVMVNGTGPGADDHKVLYTHESLCAMLETAGFNATPLEYFDAQGIFHSRPWDRADGMVHRSREFDKRNRGGLLVYTSVIVDAIKP